MKETNADHFKIGLNRNTDLWLDDVWGVLDKTIHEAVRVNGVQNKSTHDLDQLCNALTGAVTSLKVILGMHLYNVEHIPPESIVQDLFRLEQPTIPPKEEA